MRKGFFQICTPDEKRFFQMCTADEKRVLPDVYT
jgi:hypothetical protein